VSYSYPKKTQQDVEGIARDIRQRYPKRVKGTFLEIEELVDIDYGLRIEFRPWQYRVAAYKTRGFLCRDGKRLVINEYDASNILILRASLAHEFAHWILERPLWDQAKAMDGSLSHQLSDEQHREVETDAHALAGELLAPRELFSKTYGAAIAKAEKRGVDRDVATKMAIAELAKQFGVTASYSSLRAKKLGVISSATYRRCFPLIY
jgi:Zn-dependent peptidase ImmA (M78 family)